MLKKHWQTIAHWVVVGVAIGYLAWLVPGLASEASTAIGQLDHLRWGWFLVAVVCGLAPLVLYGELHRQLLRVGGSTLPFTTVQGINFVENAVSTTVPVVGGAGAIVYAIDQLRRRGIDSALASWSVLMAGVLATLCLLVMGVLGLGLSGHVPIALAAVLAAVIILGSIGAWKVVTHPAVLRNTLHLAVMLARWIPGVCHTCRDTWTVRADEVAQRLSTRITLLQPSVGQWLGLTALAASTWVLDFLSLAASVASVGAPVPWGVLLVGFLLVQGSIALQISPGGAGLAETSLLAALVTSGVAAGPAAASVLIYRSITWLGLAMLGWIVYAFWIHTAPLHLHRHAPELSEARS
ncbi:lysylphosphatidylglycerol synthase transmembrane domain-containing protein [Pseudonocardia xinjiangensis]|uniref:Flippase-like domain-containing protein n=1 Tax=Pseudonocardia xinjiangensis TaxID=75289 RepID=A0ABX1REA1_9PSEU|nr:lysylphosphatidylglycerol synthase transmembrane domain-containing protein [Pseudonocardia xinjiangensis]NMH77725.1 flippase-like domain-containing protein [Pseudonocardia xinjiangensis]